MKKLLCLVGMVFLVSLTAAAQETSRGDVFFGYSYVRANPATSGAPSFNLNGGSASFAYSPGPFGIVADFGGYHAGTIAGTSVNSNLYSYLFGPRFSYRHYDRVTPFAQVLVGGTHLTGNALATNVSRNAFATTVGGGLDVKASPHVGVRLGQVEYFLTRFQEAPGVRSTQNNLRFSTGVLFRF